MLYIPGLPSGHIKLKMNFMECRQKTRRVSHLEFYAQSTIMVISGHFTFCRQTIIVKNIKNMLKTGIYIQIFKNSPKT